MKVLVAVAVVLASAALVAAVPALDEEAVKKEALEKRAKCLADLKGTEADVKKMEETHEVTTEFDKKMILCVFRAYKLIDDNNKFAKSTILDMARAVLDGKPDQAAKMKIAEEISEACDKEAAAATGAPEELAKTVHDCLKKNAIEKKLDWKV